MRVALVYHGRYLVRQALELETLAGVLRLGGHQVTMAYDPDTFGVTDNVLQIPWMAQRFSGTGRIVQQIVDSRPDACIFSVLPASYQWSRAIAAAVSHRARVPNVFVGLHPSLVPERVMRDEFVTCVVQGEVENVICPLLDTFAAKGDLAGVKNLWYRRGEEIVATERAGLVDLEALPLPDKTLFFPHVSHNYSYAAMVSRGCPYTCSFCEETCSKKLYGGSYFRRKSVDSVMAELIAGKKKYRYREVIFKDSYLSGNKRWLGELMERYRREISVPFKCFCTTQGFDAETARLLKQGGCYSIEFGLQTWNGRIRRDILHRGETNAAAAEAFRHCADQRLWYDVDHMFNLPEETEQDHIDSARQYRRLRYLNRVKVHHLLYLPTADIVDYGMASQALPADAREKLADGWESDFYDQRGVDDQQRAMVAGYAALYKLLPVLPGRILEWLLRDGRVRRLGRIPAPFIAMLQGLMAIRSGDLRFMAYLSLYPAKVARTIMAG